MARRRRRKKKNLLDYIVIPRLNLDLDPDTKRGIFVMIIIAIGGISMLALFDMAGQLGVHIVNMLEYILGWGKWLFPLILLALGFFLFNEDKYEVRLKNYLGLILFLTSFLVILFIFIPEPKWDFYLKAGGGGGHIGIFFARKLLYFTGFWVTLILSISILLVSFMLMFNTTLIRMFGPESHTSKIFIPFSFLLNKIFNREKEEEEEDDEEEEEEEDDEEEEEEEDDEEEEEEEDDEEEEEEDDEEEEEEDDEEEEEEDDEEEEEEESSLEPKFSTSPIINEDDEDAWWMKPTGAKISFPLSLLNGKSGKADSGNVEMRQEIIKNSFDNFGIDVEMTGIKKGPTVTQYRLRPAEGVKLSKISNLSDNLAMALAAHPIRIEAPIPNTHEVGVEVPNDSKVIVGLKEILTSKNYKERSNDTLIALGRDVAGLPMLGDLANMPHLLVAGATGSGKSVCLNSIIVSLMHQNNPDDLRLILVDPKRVEMTAYKGLPYLMCPVITEVPKTINALKWCLNEMDTRYEILEKAGKRNIQSYNSNSEIKMPYLVFIIDELADLMMVARKEVEAGIIRLSQLARAVGIHLILATQRPSVDVITGIIKANMPTRIAFSVASGTDSRTILDSLGAEKLLGRGDMLYSHPEIAKPIRLQGAFLSEEEIKKVTRYIRSKTKKTNYIDSVTDRQKVRGTAGIGMDGTKGDEDELLAEAKDVVINMNKASASLLQRKLRIGYARAASILDQLEDLGIIGPPNGSKPREILMSKQELENMDNMGTSGVVLHSRDETEAPEEFLEADDEEEEEGEEGLDDDEENDNIDDEEEEEDGDDEEEAEDDSNKEEEEEEEEEDEGKFFSR